MQSIKDIKSDSYNRLYLIQNGPVLVLIAIISFVSGVTALKVGGSIAAIFFGAISGTVGLCIIRYYIGRTVFGELVISIIMLIAGLCIIYIVSASGFSALILTGCIALINVIVDLYIIVKIFRKVYGQIKVGKSPRSLLFADVRKILNGEPFDRDPARKKAIAVILTSVFVISVTLLIAPYYSTPQEFTIDDKRASEYELVLYYSRTADINDTFCYYLKQAGVSTLSIPLGEGVFKNESGTGDIAAEAIRAANKNGLKVEVFPLFAPSSRHYPNSDNVNLFGQLFSEFDNWVSTYNITVDYILWDIEMGGCYITQDQFSDHPFPLNYFDYAAAMLQKMRHNSINWSEECRYLAEVSAMAVKIGYGVRITTHTMIFDLYDGDDDLQQMYCIPVWCTGDIFEYISMMAYRGCEGGGNQSSSMIYEYVRESAALHGKPTAICIGCINYNPYPTVQSVVNDVRLALAAGADAVRIFQGVSWVYGVGADPSPGVAGAPAHGFFGEDGLVALMEECRKGGKAVYYHDPSLEFRIFLSILSDILIDF